MYLAAKIEIMTKQKRMVDANRLATKTAYSYFEGIKPSSTQGRIYRETIETIKIHGGELILLPEDYKIEKR